jgi:hypothetical protein
MIEQSLSNTNEKCYRVFSKKICHRPYFRSHVALADCDAHPGMLLKNLTNNKLDPSFPRRTIVTTTPRTRGARAVTVTHYCKHRCMSNCQWPCLPKSPPVGFLCRFSVQCTPAARPCLPSRHLSTIVFSTETPARSHCTGTAWYACRRQHNGPGRFSWCPVAATPRLVLR